MTEKQARDQYGDIRVGKFPFSANGRALIANEQIGKVKVLVEPEFGEIVGVSIAGPHATELTTESMEHFIAAHPSLSEAIHEALHSAIGHAVHV